MPSGDIPKQDMLIMYSSRPSMQLYGYSPTESM